MQFGVGGVGRVAADRRVAPETEAEASDTVPNFHMDHYKYYYSSTVVGYFKWTS